MNFFLRLRAFLGDLPLFNAVLGMTLFGVAMIYSAGQVDAEGSLAAGAWRMQFVWLLLSITALFVVLRVQVRWLEWLAVPAWVAAVLLLVLTLFIGSGAGTAASTKSWIRFGPVGLQPAQFANLATILMLGRVLGSRRDSPDRLLALWKPIAVVALPMLLVLAQPDLGTAMVFGGVLLATLFWSGTPVLLILFLVSPLLGLFLAFVPVLFYLYMPVLIGFVYFYRLPLWESTAVIGANLAAGTVAVPLWNSLKDYQRNRFIVFLDPYSDPQGAGYHHIQSKIAIGSGGLVGKGFTEGPQKRLAFLPEQHTDFIYAVIGEELGFIGACGVILVYGLILYRLTHVAERQSNPFAGIVVFGIFGAWFTHILVNVGMTVGVMPITGIPLPFLSYGGSFLLATFLALGVAQRIASERGTI